MNTTLHSIAFSQVPTGHWEEIQGNATEPPCNAIPAVASRGRFHRTPEMEMPAPYFTAFPALKSSPQCHPAPSMPPVSSAWKSGAWGEGQLPLGQALWQGVPSSS